MSTNFNFESQVCTSKVQSERLLALGLKKETADIRGVEGIEHTPIYAWSLHRLIELCFQQIYIGKRKYFHTLHLINNECVAYIDGIGNAYKYHDEGDLYNSLIRCIEWLIKEGYFNKEYLV